MAEIRVMAERICGLSEWASGARRRMSDGGSGMLSRRRLIREMSEDGSGMLSRRRLTRNMSEGVSGMAQRSVLRKE